ncbi:hypothetical protein OHB13_18500 [Streptomyces sp. NBC_00440]|uniref:hypothetical protein n=1 Tax=unclassified Streptomyces TaxID=2593676 RepID=UPI002E1B887D
MTPAVLVRPRVVDEPLLVRTPATAAFRAAAAAAAPSSATAAGTAPTAAAACFSSTTAPAPAALGSPSGFGTAAVGAILLVLGT